MTKYIVWTLQNNLGLWPICECSLRSLHKFKMLSYGFASAQHLGFSTSLRSVKNSAKSPRSFFRVLTIIYSLHFWPFFEQSPRTTRRSRKVICRGTRVKLRVPKNLKLSPTKYALYRTSRWGTPTKFSKTQVWPPTAAFKLEKTSYQWGSKGQHAVSLGLVRLGYR